MNIEVEKAANNSKNLLLKRDKPEPKWEERIRPKDNVREMLETSEKSRKLTRLIRGCP